MMQIRIMRMTVAHWLMRVWMSVRFLSIPRKTVIVLMMFVMTMAMVVRDGFVHMLVLMTLTHVQPHTDNHERASEPECDRRVFAEKQQCHTGTQEWRSRKISTGARCAE